MFSPKSEVIYEKSSSENLSREVRKKEIKKDEQLAPDSKNEGNLEVSIVGAKNNICSECRGLSVASSPETRAYVTDVTDRVRLGFLCLPYPVKLILFILSRGTILM